MTTGESPRPLSRIRILINKPHYLFRPQQLVRRLRQKRAAGSGIAVLPWGLPIRYRPHDSIGRAIARLGLDDLGASEAIWRLVDPGETTLDVGANIGQMASIMAKRAGPAGTVTCFEPHPEVFADLAQNVAAWRERSELARIECRQLALSDNVGTAQLCTTARFSTNRGTASLVHDNLETPQQVHDVVTSTLDAEIGSRFVGVMKMDVEGHELAVLRGASIAISQRRIRDIVYEDHAGYRSPLSSFLEGAGFTVFAIEHRLWSPRLRLAQPVRSSVSWGAPNYLATMEPNRAVGRLKPWGWRALRGGP